MQRGRVTYAIGGGSQGLPDATGGSDQGLTANTGSAETAPRQTAYKPRLHV
jgi:hypothetical protein